MGITISRLKDVEIPEQEEHDAEILQTAIESSTAAETSSKLATVVQDAGHLNGSQNIMPVQNDTLASPKIKYDIEVSGVIPHNNFFGLVRAKVKDVLIKDDKSFLTFIENKEIQEWSISAVQNKETKKKYPQKIYNLPDEPKFSVFEPNVYHIAIAGENRTVSILDIQQDFSTLSILNFSTQVSCLGFQPHTSIIAVGLYTKGVSIYSHDGKLIKNLYNSSPKPSSLLYTPDGKYLIIGSQYGRVEVFDTHDYSKKAVLEVGEEPVFDYDSNSDNLFCGDKNGDITICKFPELIKYGVFPVGTSNKNAGNIKKISLLCKHELIAVISGNQFHLCNRYDGDKVNIKNRKWFKENKDILETISSFHQLGDYLLLDSFGGKTILCNIKTTR